MWRTGIIDIIENVENVTLRNKDWIIDFQSENHKKWISADFLRMSENMFAESPWDGGDKVSRS